MQYLTYFLAFISFTIYVQPVVEAIPAGGITYSCPLPGGNFMNIPITAVKGTTQNGCTKRNIPGPKFADFPKKYKPFYNQITEFKSPTNNYFINPLNQGLYKNVYVVMNENCDISDVVMAGPQGLQISKEATPPGSPIGAKPYTPGKSVRTRPDQRVAQPVQARAIDARSESNNEKSDHSSILAERDVTSAGIRSCRKKVASTYSWEKDVAGTGRPLGSIPVPGRRFPL